MLILVRSTSRARTRFVFVILEVLSLAPGGAKIIAQSNDMAIISQKNASKEADNSDLQGLTAMNGIKNSLNSAEDSLSRFLCVFSGQKKLQKGKKGFCAS